MLIRGHCRREATEEEAREMPGEDKAGPIDPEDHAKHLRLVRFSLCITWIAILVLV